MLDSMMKKEIGLLVEVQAKHQNRPRKPGPMNSLKGA